METVIAPIWPLVERERLTGLAGPVMILAPGQALEGVDTSPGEGVCVAIRPVAEAMKRVGSGWVKESLDREELVEPVLPMILSESALAMVLASSSHDPLDLLETVAGLGVPVTALGVID